MTDDDRQAGASGVDFASVHPLGGRGVAEVTLGEFATRWIMQVADVADIGRYASANTALREQVRTRSRVVFLGDSITEYWTGLQDLAPPGVQAVNRGIAGQGTVQMLLRIQEDVVNLDPDHLVLSAGINDLRAFVGDARSAGEAARIRVLRNVKSMADIARANGIGVTLGALTPVHDAAASPQSPHRDPGAIVGLNAELQALATRRGFGFLDYHAALVGPDGLMEPSLSDDGLHPNAAGYERMRRVLEGAGVLDA